MDAMRADSKLRKSVRNHEGDPPLMFAVEVEELASPPAQQGTGFAFFHGRGSGRPRRVTPAHRRPRA